MEETVGKYGAVIEQALEDIESMKRRIEKLEKAARP